MPDIPYSADELEPGVEGTIYYPQFWREWIVRRIADLSTVHPLSKLPQLPTDAVLHVVDNMLMDGELSFVPRDNNPLMALPPPTKYITHVKEVTPEPTDIVPPDTTDLILQGLNVTTKLLKYRQLNSKRMREVMNITMFPLKRSDIQLVVSYNSLYRARLTGLFRPHRLWKYVFANIINTIAQVPNRHHFIHIPAKKFLVNRQHFLRSFMDHSRTSVRFQNEPYYLFMMHLIDYVESHATTSLFHGIPLELADKIHFVLTYEDRFIIYNLKLLKTLNGDENQILVRVIAHLNALVTGEKVDEVSAIGKPEDAVIPETELEGDPVSDSPETLVRANVPTPKIITVKPSSTTGLNTPNYTADALPKVHAVTEMIEDINASADKVIEAQDRLTPSQQRRVTDLKTAWKEVVLNGVKMGELLDVPEGETQDTEKLDPRPIKALDDAQTPDKSMLTSTIESMDKDYMSKQYSKDLAATLISFNAHGMFLKGVDQEHQVDELNRMTRYSVHYEDVNHVNHTVRFTLPIVDDNGCILVNGSTKSMKKQRVARPICKISAFRVALNTCLNKALVERTTTVAHSFDRWFLRNLSAEALRPYVQIRHGHYKAPNLSLPYEYTALGHRIGGFTVKARKTDASYVISDLTTTFDYERRFEQVPPKIATRLQELEKTYGVYIGSNSLMTHAVFMSIKGTTTLVAVDPKNAKIDPRTLADIVNSINGAFDPNQLSEWVELRLLDKQFPVIFALCYRYGLTGMLNYLGVNYTKLEAKARYSGSVSDIVIRFQDAKLVIPRTPLAAALLFGGLTAFDLSEVNYSDMDSQDIYYELIQSYGLSIHTIKGITSFFDFFLDPMTRDVLKRMGEPTNVRDLLLRATALLTTQDHAEASSDLNFRFRSFERIPGEVYNALARAHETYRHRSMGSSNKFSINEYTIKKNILQDQLTENVSIINPIESLKQKTLFSHMGIGGRSSDTFTIEDRRFAADSIGTISEATVDNSKVALNAYMTANPRVTDIRGIPDAPSDRPVEPAELLGVTSLLMPCVTQDDVLGRMPPYDLTTSYPLAIDGSILLNCQDGLRARHHNVTGNGKRDGIRTVRLVNLS